ncbi:MULTISPECIES: hypothetical protein [Streptomyces]|uniref:Uncharacterized protein n=1 Tax=Streptomyces spororaveus TaxID=284039 RepID=A0ABQ3TFU9_9ACTN|nr:hypothetical protein [Streptomyces spororaveus]MCM9080388.1 hypothetical protein [Streptomyces spororaveus]GHI79288.1 hypothetical protein Sspor_48490 [Streptomyces spororaveus]
MPWSRTRTRTRPRSRPKAVRMCFGAAVLCLLAAALLAVWNSYAQS